MTFDGPRFAPAADREVVRWRNGQGTTQVVAEAELWRVSIADEPTESTFSVIEDMDRLLTPIGSEPMDLIGPALEQPVRGSTDDVVRYRVEPLQTFAFPGEWAPQGRVARPSRALNVMGRRGRVEMTVRIGDPSVPVATDAVRIYVDLATEDAMILPPGDFAAPNWSGTCAVVSIAFTGH